FRDHIPNLIRIHLEVRGQFFGFDHAFSQGLLPGLHAYPPPQKVVSGSLTPIPISLSSCFLAVCFIKIGQNVSSFRKSGRAVRENRYIVLMRHFVHLRAHWSAVRNNHAFILNPEFLELLTHKLTLWT